MPIRIFCKGIGTTVLLTVDVPAVFAFAVFSVNAPARELELNKKKNKKNYYIHLKIILKL